MHMKALVHYTDEGLLEKMHFLKSFLANQWSEINPLLFVDF